MMIAKQIWHLRHAMHLSLETGLLLPLLCWEYSSWCSAYNIILSTPTLALKLHDRFLALEAQQLFNILSAHLLTLLLRGHFPFKFILKGTRASFKRETCLASMFSSVVYSSWYQHQFVMLFLKALFALWAHVIVVTSVTLQMFKGLFPKTHD